MVQLASGQEHRPPVRVDKNASEVQDLIITPAQALEDIRGYALAGRIAVVRHAAQRMRERGVSFADLRHALATATVCHAEADDRWRVDGTDVEGDALTAVVALEDGVVVVTLF